MMDNVNILVAEDYEFNQLIIKQLLHSIGSGYVVVNNGKEALEQLSTQSFDIIFMDIEMPVMDGAEATRLIKSSDSDEISRIPVIGFTSHKDVKILNELRESGFVDFIHKPFKKEEIIAIIEQYVIKQKDTIDEVSVDSETPEEKSYDLTNIRAFCDNDEGFVHKMLEYFVDNAPKVIQSMKQNYALENWEDLRMEAHKFSSELGLLGISKMMTLAGEIEEKAAQKIGTDEFSIIIDQMGQCGTKIISQIKSDFNI